MTEEKKEIYNGGPAFPLDLKVGDDHRWGHGMSLRDYFAATALQGLVYDGGLRAVLKAKEISYLAYEYADAMIEQRTK